MRLAWAAGRSVPRAAPGAVSALQHGAAPPFAPACSNQRWPCPWRPLAAAAHLHLPRRGRAVRVVQHPLGAAAACVAAAERAPLHVHGGHVNHTHAPAAGAGPRPPAATGAAPAAGAQREARAAAAGGRAIAGGAATAAGSWGVAGCAGGRGAAGPCVHACRACAACAPHVAHEAHVKRLACTCTCTSTPLGGATTTCTGGPWNAAPAPARHRLARVHTHLRCPPAQRTPQACCCPDRLRGRRPHARRSRPRCRRRRCCACRRLGAGAAAAPATPGSSGKMNGRARTPQRRWQTAATAPTGRVSRCWGHRTGPAAAALSARRAAVPRASLLPRRRRRRAAPGEPVLRPRAAARRTMLMSMCWLRPG